MHWRLLSPYTNIVVILPYFFSFFFSCLFIYQLLYSSSSNPLPSTYTYTLHCVSPPARPPLLRLPLLFSLFSLFLFSPCQIAVESASKSLFVSCLVSLFFFYLPSSLILFLFFLLLLFHFYFNFHADFFPKREQREKNSHPLRGTD